MDTPKLRFKDFTEDWTSSKLQTLLIESKKKSLGNENGIVLTSSRKGLFPRSKYFDGREEENTTGYSLVPKNSFTYRQMSDDNTFFINLNKDFELGLVSPEYPVFTTNNALDTTYFANYINDSRAFKQFCQLQKKGGTRTRLYFKVLQELEIKMPTLEEQKKIGIFFETLNKKIQLQQEKIDLLKKQKKGYMQKIFSQELRFEDFSTEWKQAPLENIANFFDNLRVPITSINRIKGNTPYYGANGIQDYVEGYTHDGEFVLIAEDGASDLVDYPVNYVNGQIWVNNHAHVVNGKEGILNTLYLTYRLKSMNIAPWLVGGGRAKLNGEVLKKIPISYPPFEEQIKIGKFINAYDIKIKIQQEKLNLLKQQKQAFMQQMFI